MSEDNNSSSASCGCGGCGGCVMFVIFIFMVTAIGWGVSIGKHKWNIDIFPPRVWDMNEQVEETKTEPVVTEPETPDTVTE